MIEADCRDQLCVNQKAISADGESIICLPNKIVVEVESDKESELDAVMKQEAVVKNRVAYFGVFVLVAHQCQDHPHCRADGWRV